MTTSHHSTRLQQSRCGISDQNLVVMQNTAVSLSSNVPIADLCRTINFV